MRSITSTARSSGAGSLLESSGNNLGRKVKELAKVVNTLVGEGVVVVLPRELGLDIATRSQRLHSLDDLEVGDINILVLGEVVVLRGDQDTIYFGSNMDWLSKKGSNVMRSMIVIEKFSFSVVFPVPE